MEHIDEGEPPHREVHGGGHLGEPLGLHVVVEQEPREVQALPVAVSADQQCAPTHTIQPENREHYVSLIYLQYCYVTFLMEI